MQLSLVTKNSEELQIIYIVIDINNAINTRKYCHVVLGPYPPSLMEIREINITIYVYTIFMLLADAFIRN